MFSRFRLPSVAFLVFIFFGLQSCTTSSQLTERRRSGEAEKVDAPELKSGKGGDSLSDVTVPPLIESFRDFHDPIPVAEIYKNGLNAWQAGDRRKALAYFEKYLASGPNVQFADDVALKFAEEAQDRFDDQTAIGYCNRVISMVPVSKLRGVALYRRAISERRLGNTGKALESMAQIRFSEIEPSKSPEIFFFWGDVASEAGRWLEATLAYVKVYYLDTDPQRKAAAEKLVLDQVDRRLGEPELNFLLKEYANNFPNQAVRLRLVAVFLARGDRSSAEELLKEILGTSSPNSEAYRSAQSMLARFESLGNVSTTRIGVLLPLSGRLESIGRAIADGLKLSLEGMDSAHKIDLVFGDTGPTLETAKIAFERLLFDERVLAVMGPLQGDAAEYVATRCTEFAVPNVSLGVRSGLVEKGPFIFRLASTASKETAALVHYASKKLNATRFAVMFPRDQFGEMYAQAYFQAVEDVGGEITAAESYLPKQTDFFTQLDNMTGLAFQDIRKKESDDMAEAEKTRLNRELTKRELGRLQLPPIVDFDVLFIPDRAATVGQIVPALPYRNVTGVTLLGPSMWNNQELLRRAGQYLNGAIFVDSFAPTRGAQVTRNFSEQYQIRFGKVPTAMSAIGYDLGQSLRKLYERNGVPTSRESFRSRLASLGEIDGALGMLRWDSSRDALAEFQVFEIKRGVFVHEAAVH